MPSFWLDRTKFRFVSDRPGDHLRDVTVGEIGPDPTNTLHAYTDCRTLSARNREARDARLIEWLQFTHLCGTCVTRLRRDVAWEVA